ncbi:MAG: potassium channel family protein [Spirochaetota bacterium]
MRNIMIIGLGNFGYNIARTLYQNSFDVLCIDSREDVVNMYKDSLGYVISLDATQKDQLDSLQLDNYETAIISIGQDITASILISLHLKELGIPRIITRAISEDHGKVLEKIGVDEIIYPELDTALKIAHKLMMKNVADYLPLGVEFGIVEIAPPPSFVGKSLAELDITKRFACQVIGIRSYEGILSTDEEASHTKIAPQASDRIEHGNKIIVLGKNSDIQRLHKAR